MKEYGAYYNAAAHLRRAHFKPKTPKGRSKGLKEAEEKRGGKGGGDWPSMAELKPWMKEVEVVAHEHSQQDEGEASDDEIDATSEQTQSLSDINTNGYQTSYYAEPPPFNNNYQQQSDMFDMSISLDTQSQYADQSLYYTSSQETFLPFSTQVLQNDPLAFHSQHFGDPGSVTGPEFENFSY